MSKQIRICLSPFNGWRLEMFNAHGVRILRAYSLTYAPLRAFSDHFQNSLLYCVHIRPCSLPSHFGLRSVSSVAWCSPSDVGQYIVA